ncbi:MAG: flagellar hook-associated protein FlgK [Deltaproteobacteria bacterium]|nr:flagellar hook-associated protein FlgK [Deltaproteobacteria bacterium]
MGGLYDALGVGLNTLVSHQAGIAVTGHNIANVNTEGFHRQEVQVKARGSGTYGIEIAKVRRHTDEFLARRLHAQEGTLGHSNARASGLQSVEAVVGNQGEFGLSATLDRFFASWRELSVFPQEASQRGETLTATQSLVNAVQRIDDTIADAREDANIEIGRVVGEVNVLIADVSRLNREIVENEAYGEDANELKDQRDNAARDLGELMGATTTYDEDGSISIQLGGGVNLVQRDTTIPLEARNRDDDGDGVVDSPFFDIWANSGVDFSVNDRLGGKLAGLLQLRDVDLADRENELDEFAYDLVNATNAVHEANFDLDGNAGSNLFDAMTEVSGAAEAITINADIEDDVDLLAAADSAANAPGSGVGALAMAQIEQANIASSGTQTLSESANLLQTNYLFSLREALHAEEGSGQRLDLLDQLRESHSGVSIEEEMMSLSKYQRAFQGASKVMTTVDQMLQTLIGM